MRTGVQVGDDIDARQCRHVDIDPAGEGVTAAAQVESPHP